ncbi:60S ribosomal protein L18a-like protein [Momordica charantia]|uniref:60S ribosomal protein L18a-like protein n=1 Tax=Momordica charantia TaxID=3673 RepID=A0A6J1C1R6_MOMCH|nr:60S ribosomal protein L18a-like protein [Momordica charantia]
MSQEEKAAAAAGVVVHHHHESNSGHPQYGTFQGVANYPPVGFPQPIRPPGASDSYDPSQSQPYAHAYQAVPGYAIVEGRPVRERRLPCCGIGIGWFLFIIGFFIVGIPWYAGAIVILCGRVDYREKPGYVACTIAAILGTLALILGVTKGVDVW